MQKSVFNLIVKLYHENVFNELRFFANEKEDLIAQTVFKFNSNLFFGGYDRKTNTYSFYKFQD